MSNKVEKDIDKNGCIMNNLHYKIFLYVYIFDSSPKVGGDKFYKNMYPFQFPHFFAIMNSKIDVK